MTRPSVHDETMSKVDDTLLEGDIRRDSVFNIILASQTSADLGREGSIVNTDTREEKVSLSSHEDAQIKDDEKMVHGKEGEAQLYSGVTLPAAPNVTSRSPGRKLLARAIQTRRPILAIVASCFADVSVLDCWVVWLSVQDNIDSEYPNKDVRATTIGNSFGDPSSVIGQTDGNSFSWTPSDSVSASMNQLRPVLINLCKRHDFGQLLQSFSIFAPSSILLQFFLFYKAFVASRYDVAAKHMDAFVSGTNLCAEEGSIGTEADGAPANQNPFHSKQNPQSMSGTQVQIPRTWIDNLALELTHYLLTETVDDAYGCEQLLSILAKARFSPEYELLDRTYSLLQRMRVFDDNGSHSKLDSSKPVLLPAAVVRKHNSPTSDVDSGSKQSSSWTSSTSSDPVSRTWDRMRSAELFTPPPKVLTMLIDRGLFHDARAYAKTARAMESPAPECNIITDQMIHNVTFAEVQAMLKAFQKNFLWHVHAERTKFWVRCFDVFEQHSFPNARAAEFLDK